MSEASGDDLGGASDPPEDNGDERDRFAARRDRDAAQRDQASEARDAQAKARDERAEARELPTDRSDPVAASDREGAKRDRLGSAGDREHAVDDRQASSADRVLSAAERQAFLVDGLTGARRRDAGLLELGREILRAHRTHQTYVLVFVDVDGLKKTNDAHGHPAGDDLLAQVAATIRNHLRPYDLIVRYGGDEFLCGLMDLKLADTVERFALVNEVLTNDHGASITAGVAQLQPGDQLQDLIDRADQALYTERKRRPPLAD